MSIRVDTEYLIIGAGFSGLAMAWKLKQSSEDDFLIYERAAGLGGTWRANTYPGCACDVPAHVYSYSFEQKPDWTHLFARQQELLEYLEEVADKYHLYEHLRYNEAVNELRYCKEQHIWRAKTAEGGVLTARYVIAAPGPLATPAFPKISGREEFEGVMFHSAEWRHDVDLTEKRVAVIGTGASAIQFIPEIADKVARLTVFQRTASWVIPRDEKKFSDREKKWFRQRPGLVRTLRRWLYGRLEMRAIGFVRHPRVLKIYEWLSKWNLRKQVKDPVLREKLTPKFRFGCKRILLSTEYYPAMALETTDVETGGIEKIVSDGIITTDGRKIDVDIIILGTGFRATEPMPEIAVYGTREQELHREWARDGPAAYYGACMNGYPNLFMLLGPNTGLGHNSVVYMAEAQVEGIYRILNAAKAQGKNTVHIKGTAQTEFNKTVQDRLAHSVWQRGGCSSWYQTASGKNVTLWPDYTFRFKRELAALPFDAFEFSNPASKAEG